MYVYIDKYSNTMIRVHVASHTLYIRSHALLQLRQNTITTIAAHNLDVLIIIP